MDITVRIHYEQLSLNPKLKLDSALAISKLRENTFHYNLSYFKHFLNVKKVGSNSGTMIEKYYRDHCVQLFGKLPLNLI